MAASFTAVESSDGLTITFTDTTTPPIAGAIRSFVLTDYLGNPLATLPLATGDNTATYSITKPTWIDVHFINTGSSPFDVFERFGFYQVFKDLYGNVLTNGGTGCSNCNNSKIDWCDVDAYDRGAEFALPIGDSVRWQNDMNAAYTLLQP